MHFYGEFAASVPLSVPIVRHDTYFAEPIAVTVSGKRQALRGDVVRPFRCVTQAMLTDETRLFIELVQ